MKKKYVVVYDIETLKSCFTYIGVDIYTSQTFAFVIHKDRFELKELLKHLKECKAQVGFNNLSFDYPIIHLILKNGNKWLRNKLTAQQIVTIIYEKAQEIISNQNVPGYYSSIREKDVIIPQLDLFKIWHYDNKARMTGLKALQISMNYPNVLDMPINHDNNNITEEDIPEILRYNLNDVLATLEFFKKSKPKIDLRNKIRDKYDIPCRNFSDSKIGESLILKLYCDKMGLDPWDVKNLRTKRDVIYIKSVIFDYISFKSKEFNELLDFFNNVKVIDGVTKNLFKKSVRYKGFKYDYGVGGIHGCIKPGVYNADDRYVIIDADVASLYPNIAIKNRLYIQHLGAEFIDLYDKEIVQERLKAKKAGEMGISDALKLSANSVYGKSNDKHSFLYDPKYTMATTINGQLLLTMLSERLVDTIKDSTVLQINTDGVTLKIPRDQEKTYYNICKQWEKDTMLTLEYVEYSKMVIRDVNNYLAVSSNEIVIKNDEVIKLPKVKIKHKGAFEVDKVVGAEPAYHKDNSFRIVPLAISNYFTEDIPIETTIMNHDNIYDFCGRQKFNRDSYGEIVYIDGMTKVVKKQQHNVRYYISKSGKTFVKQYLKGDSEIINKGFQVEVFNDYIKKPMNEYNIDYSFYIKEANKIIDIIEDKQLSLF